VDGENKAGTEASAAAKEKGRSVGGYITIYLVLTLVSILTLYMVLISGARIGAARMQMESVSRISQNAALAEFHKEMHSRYDLFFTDTSYGGPGGGNDVFAQHLRNYMDSNCARKTALVFGGIRDWTSMEISDVRVPEARYACDNGGKAVREQVYAYMSADPAGAVISGMLVTADQWRGLEISGREWTTRTDENSEELKQALRNGREEQREENERKEENEEEVSETEREAASDEPSEAEDMVDHRESFPGMPVATEDHSYYRSVGLYAADEAQLLRLVEDRIRLGQTLFTFEYAPGLQVEWIRKTIANSLGNTPYRSITSWHREELRLLTVRFNTNG
jgi:hypothetical protein